MRSRLVAALSLAILVPSIAAAGQFYIRDVHYKYAQNESEYLYVMVGTSAEYRGTSVDPGDDSWEIETSLTYLGQEYRNYPTYGKGIPNVGYVIKCPATSCGAFHDIPYCNAQNNGSSYHGVGYVAIYHQTGPEPDSGTAGWETTNCTTPPDDDSPLDPVGGSEPAPGDGTCNAGCPGTTTPVLIDLDRAAFRLTSFEGGVLFDLDRDGVAEKLSWTARGSGDGWLMLDRNSNGLVDDGGELFGDSTDQPASPAPDGYKALAVFDEDGDGWITDADAVYAGLQVWVDDDQDGRSQPDELLSLALAGVTGIELSPVESRRTDSHGNEFRLTARVRLAQGTTRSADVFLLTSDP